MNSETYVYTKIANNISLSQIEETIERIKREVPYLSSKLGNLRVEDYTIEDFFKTAFENNVITQPEDLVQLKLSPKSLVNELYAMFFTSGSTGNQKPVPYTFFGDGLVTREQYIDTFKKYFPPGSRIISLFPTLPASSGEMFKTATIFVKMIDGIGYGWYQIPQSLLAPQYFSILIERIKQLKPRIIGGLPTTIYNILNSLPEEYLKDLEVVIVGGEELSTEVARKIFSLVPNLFVISNVWGTTEAGAMGVENIEKSTLPVRKIDIKNLVALIKPEADESYNNQRVGRVYLTKIEPKDYSDFGIRKAPLGVYLLNHNIGDYVVLDDENNISRVFREKDVVSLGGAKLYLSSLLDIIHQHEEFVDMVITYYPLSPQNSKPKAIIEIGYAENLPNPPYEKLREVERKVLETNFPVFQETQVTKMAELEFKLVPLKDLIPKLYEKPGKPQRIKIIKT